MDTRVIFIIRCVGVCGLLTILGLFLEVDKLKGLGIAGLLIILAAIELFRIKGGNHG